MHNTLYEFVDFPVLGHSSLASMTNMLLLHRHILAFGVSSYWLGISTGRSALSRTGVWLMDHFVSSSLGYDLQQHLLCILRFSYSNV